MRARGYAEVWITLVVTSVLVVGFLVIDDPPGEGDAVPAPVVAATSDVAAGAPPGRAQGPTSAVGAATQLAGSTSSLPGPGAEPAVGSTPTSLELILSGRSDLVPSPVEPPPEQVGYLSVPAAQAPVPAVSVDGGLLEPQPATVVVSAVTAIEESVDVVDSKGLVVTGADTVGSSPVAVEMVDDGSTRLSSSTASAVPDLSVRVLDSATAQGAGLGEVAFVVEAAGGATSSSSSTASADELGELAQETTVRFSVDYSAFVDEYGGDWARRLRVARFPECALRRETGCGPQFAGEFVNDVERQVLTFEVPLGELMPDGALAAASSSSSEASSGAPALTAAEADGPVGFAMMAGASGAGGDYATTSLNPAGSWAVGTQSGSFTWSYPIAVPAPPAGPSPGLSVTYSASAIDGLTSDQNTQGGVMGPGWSIGEGFIERQYRPCGADSGAGGEFCWGWDNATFSFGGLNGELVNVATESSGQTGWEARVYRLASHSGWKVVRYRRTNLTTARGSLGVDNDLEYWVATAPDGTRYWFGYGQQTGSFTPGTVLGSVQTVPVVGNHPGEPCNNLANIWCHQAYRWSLDRIEDANGRVITFDYIQETNFYGVRGAPAWSEPYVSAAVLERIEYGQLAANAAIATIHTNEVTFGYQWRCNDPVNGVCSGQPTSSNGSRFPDIPADQICGDSYCTNYAPTFFHQRMLVSVTSKARDASGAVVNVAQDMLAYEWVEADGPTSDRLWLTSIQHRGLAAGGNLWLPAVRLGRSGALANRVDYNTAGGVTPMFYYRVGSILDEYGGELRVGYTRTRACSSSSLPANWANNTWSCFPRWWTPPSGPAGFSAWHRYVVGNVVVVDQSGDVAATTKLVEYAYPQSNGSTAGGMAWHSDTNTLAPVATRSWGEFRGFEYVDVTVGHANEANRQVTRHVFHQGMDDDINSHSDSSVARDDEVTPSTLGDAVDADQLAGLEREVIVLNFERNSVLGVLGYGHQLSVVVDGGARRLPR